MTGFECRFCGRDDLSARGITSHETHCDENPNPGISPAKQQELGILESEGADPDDSPNPHQESDESAGGLPSVETLGGGNNTTESGQTAATDGGEVSECPLCDAADVLPAADAKTAYIDAVEHPNPKAVLGYELAEHACQNPECAALWGGKYDEPLPMKEVVEA
jgi:hypothetical protein